MTKQEIPSESRQQVVNELNNIKGNVILTGSVLGLPEAYLNEYKKENNQKIVIVTEPKIQAVLSSKESQQKLEQICTHALDTSFYIESKLVQNLCEQFIDSKLQDTRWIKEEKEKRIKYLRNLQTKVIKSQRDFFLSSNQNANTHYDKNMYFKRLKQIMEEYCIWEWEIMQIDKPIEEAEMLQKCMFDIINLDADLRPSRVLLTAYDAKIQSRKKWNQFTILKLEDSTDYYQIVQESLLILSNLYPQLQEDVLQNNIRIALNSPALQQLYMIKNYPTNAFMRGIQEFYNVCSRNNDEYRLNELKCFSLLYACIQKNIEDSPEEQKKKSKLYI